MADTRPITIGAAVIDTYDDTVAYLKNLRTKGRTVRKAAAECKEFGAEKILGFLQQAVLHADEVLRCEALDLIAHISPEHAVAEAGHLLQSANPEVRRAACDILGECPTPDSEQVLLTHLGIEQEPFVRYAATASLRWVGTGRSIPTLSQIAATDKSQDFEGRPIGELASDLIMSLGQQRR